MTSKLDLVILREEEIRGPEDTGTGLGGELHSVESNLDKLAKAWPIVMERLRRVIESDANTATVGGLKVDTVEFSIGLEGGVNIGLAATASASATITFKRG